MQCQQSKSFIKSVPVSYEIKISFQTRKKGDFKRKSPRISRNRLKLILKVLTNGQQYDIINTLE